MKIWTISAIIIIILPSAVFAQGDDNCPNDPAVIRVEAVKFYSNAQGSIIDPQKLHDSLRSIAPLRRFVSDVSRRVESDDHAQQTCAQNMMLAWAQSGAMLEEPKDFAGMRERERFTIALNIIALKLKARGFDSGSLLGWLGDLNHAVIADFAKRGREDNLYAWSGVSAASYALLSGDGMARNYEDTVWEHAVGLIRPDGYLDAELARAGRALLYHEYDLSALLTLHAFRKALGEALSHEEHANLQHLVDRVSSSLCDPSGIVAASGGYLQEKIPSLQFSPVVAFGRDMALGNPLLGRCFPSQIPDADPVLGGNFHNTVEIVANSHRSP